MKIKKPKFLTNWKTTVTGIVACIVTAGPELLLLIDDDPATNPSWQLVAGAFAVLFGLAAARDGDKSSEGKKV